MNNKIKIGLLISLSILSFGSVGYWFETKPKPWDITKEQQDYREKYAYKIVDEDMLGYHYLGEKIDRAEFVNCSLRNLERVDDEITSADIVAKKLYEQCEMYYIGVNAYRISGIKNWRKNHPEWPNKTGLSVDDIYKDGNLLKPNWPESEDHERIKDNVNEYLYDCYYIIVASRNNHRKLFGYFTRNKDLGKFVHHRDWANDIISSIGKR